MLFRRASINHLLTQTRVKKKEPNTGADLCQNSLGLVTTTKTTSSKWPSGQPSPDWPRLWLRLRKTTGLNLLSRFHWVKLREWREPYFTDRMRWGLWLKSLMETSKLTWWDNYKGEWDGGGVPVQFLPFSGITANNFLSCRCNWKCSDVVCPCTFAKAFKKIAAA